MAKKQTLPKRKKRFNVKVIKVVCGDCEAVMDRWENPYDAKEDHIDTICPVCGMHIKHYTNTFYCVDESNRAYLEVNWDMTLEKKKEFLEKEKDYWDRVKAQREEFDKFERDLQKPIEEDGKEQAQ